MILALNVCSEKEKERCRAEIGNEEFLKWACEKCEKKSPQSIRPWTMHLMELRTLMKAGYPFKKEDLSFNEWRDLGILNEMIDAKMCEIANSLSSLKRIL